VTPEIYAKICDRTIGQYMKRDNYYKIDGCPVYMIFDPDNLIRTFGSTEACRKGLDLFREKAAAAGFPGLHIQFNHWDRSHFNWLPDGDPNKGKTPAELYEYLGVDSVTSYNWGASVNFDGDFSALADEYFAKTGQFLQTQKTPFYPNLSVG
ncbi:MAG: hypothetical protein IKW76_13980, partial [Clostridia bacterium]|nr:hypothetical protein [Clostridia bacterium]